MERTQARRESCSSMQSWTTSKAPDGKDIRRCHMAATWSACRREFWFWEAVLFTICRPQVSMQNLTPGDASWDVYRVRDSHVIADGPLPFYISKLSINTVASSSLAALSQPMTYNKIGSTSKSSGWSPLLGSTGNASCLLFAMAAR